MHSLRRVLVLAAATAVATVGVAGVAGADSDHGMTKQEMKCMAKKYAKNNPKKCKVADAHDSGAHGGEVALTNELAYTSDGLIDVASVDFSGTKTVSRRDEKRAEKLLKKTVKALPKWSDIEQAKAAGFQSIGDGLTGEEHLLHWDWVDDDTIFDPNYPESLVYKVDRATGQRTLEAAMYILPKEYKLDKTPKVDSNLVQFHLHDNLCFTEPPAPQVRGLTNAEGGCNPPLVKFNPNIQVHVWIRENDCGPFASLLGVGAGQIKSGAERSCVHDPDRLSL